MSQLLIQHYLNELQTLRRVSGTSTESVVREAFKTLLKDWGKSHDLIFIPEYEYITLGKDRRLIDGALLHALRVPLGYWEAKDEKDNLDDEIEIKFRRGYPQDNIIFDDSHTAVLIQNKNEVMRCGVEDVAQLEKLLKLFFGYEREEIADFRKAVEQFKTDLPEVLKRQNKRKISVVIGNPPYNANQLNENENNKNREYPMIDEGIKGTYIASSDAQKTKLYDMYVRFFRWASDRIENNGIVAFVSNSSFVHKPSFDGFRKEAAKDFSEIWIVDLKGDARSSGERRRREGGNIFGDQIKVGVAVSFFIKKVGAAGCRIHYEAVRDYAKAEEKSDFLRAKKIDERLFDELKPDKKGNWVSVIENDFETFLPIASKDTKAVKIAGQERAIFRLYSLGISTNRDEWLYDMEPRQLEKKVRYLIEHYDRVKRSAVDFPDEVKWSETLKRRKHAGQSEPFSKRLFRRAAYRPFFAVSLYQSPLFIDRPGLSDTLFPPASKNIAICFSDVGSRTDYCVLSIDGLADLHFGAAVDAYQQVSRFRFVDGERVDNITDWSLAQFQEHYEKGKKIKRLITKDSIFHYVYGILHDPTYRGKYAQNLKREFPRIPFYADFWRWAEWGEKLTALHIGYETVEPWPLERIDTPDEKSRKAKIAPKAMLKADKETGNIRLDSETQLTGVPPEAWAYRLGNRSALEWILDQYKEKTPKDPTIREKFNTYRFADHKEKVIDLLKRVTRVSVETMKIVEAMKTEKR